jgi:hypothetical protein
MLLKFFKRQVSLVEVTDSSGQKRVMSNDQYVSNAIAERRGELELLRLGFSARRPNDYRAEYTMRRWIS